MRQADAKAIDVAGGSHLSFRGKFLLVVVAAAAVLAALIRLVMALAVA
jgi:hypothetical protein